MARVMIGLLLLSCSIASAKGEILVGNLSEPVRDATPISNPMYWAAQSFIMDNRYVQLTSIDAYVGDAIGTPDVVAELRWHDVNGQIDFSPTGLITTFSVPDVSGTIGPRTFVPDSPVTLLPNGGYWFVLGGTTPDTYFWSYANTGAWEGAGILDWFADSSDAGTTWTYYGDPGPFFPYMIQVDVALRSGDFDANGLYECADVDALTAEISAGTQTPFYDLTGDGVVDLADLDTWLAEAGQANLPSQNAYLYGDADLDGVVDGSDFIIWNAHKFTDVAAWCSGDFNADGVVDGIDFIAWNAHKFTSADARSNPVPEPGSTGTFAMLLAAAAAFGRRKTRCHRTTAVKLRRVSSFGLSVELLEDRRVLSTINWVNRGTTDNFGVYGGNANLARDIVDRAIVDWQRVIDNFNYAEGGNTFSVTVTAADQGGGGRGVTNNILRNNATQKKPVAANIQMDDNGGGSGWYFDPVPWANAVSPDDGEFTMLLTPFTADNGNVGNDFYRTIVHELGHAMGLGDDTNGYLRIADFLEDAGFDDPNGGRLKTINLGGGAIEYTLTTAGGGHLWEGGTTPYTGPAHPNDLMNDGRTVGLGLTRRQLITDTDAFLLADVYGYSINLPSTINTMLVNPNYTSDVLTVSGQSGNVVDVITIQGTAVPGELHTTVGPYVEIVPWPQLSQIVVNAGGGGDFIRMEFNGGLTTSINGGDGDDFVDFSFSVRNLSNLTGPTTVTGGNGADSIFVYDNNNPLAAGFLVNADTLWRSGFGEITHDASVEFIHLTTGAGADTVDVLGTRSGSTLFLQNAGFGTQEIINVGYTLQGAQLIQGDVVVHNDPWQSFLNISDEFNSNPRTATIDFVDGTSFGVITGLAAGSILWDNADIQEINITTGGGNDVITNLRSSETINFYNTGGRDNLTVGDNLIGMQSITGAIGVGPNAGLVFTDITLNNAADTVGRNVTWAFDGAGFVIAGLSFANIRYDYQSVVNLSVLGGSGNDNFTLNGISDDWAITNINGGSGFDTLVVDDRTMPFSLDTAYVRPDQFYRLLGVAIGIVTNFSNIESPSLYLQAATTAVTVFGTASSIPSGSQLTIYGGPNSETFTVHPRDANGLPSVLGAMGIIGGAGIDSIVVDDSASSTGAEWVIENYFGAGTQNFVVGGGAYFGSLNDVENVILSGSAGDDIFYLDRYQSGTSLQVFGNEGNDRLDVTSSSLDVLASITSISYFNFDGGNGYDQFLVYNDNGPGGWDYVGANDYFRALGPSYTLTLHDANVEYLYATGGAQHDRFFVESVPASSVIALDGGDGNNEFFVGSNGLTRGIFGGVQLYATFGTNAITIDNSADAIGRTVHVDVLDVGAAPGDDLFGPGGYLLYNNVSGPLTVKLGAGDDTVYVVPHPYTPIAIDDPNPLLFGSADFLGLAFANVTNPTLTVNGATSGTYTFDDAASIMYVGMETLSIDDVAPEVVSALFLETPVHRVLFEFSEDISPILRASDLLLTDLATGQPIATALVALSYDTATNNAEFTFPGLPDGQLPAGDYRAAVADHVSDLFGNPLAPFAPFDFSVPSTTIDGDFNDDGIYDLVDIDALVAAIAAVTHDPAFDLTGDGLVNLTDRDAWLAEAGSVNLASGNAYLLGDANLDGFVDGLDFIAWNSHKFTAMAAWSAGDFTADGVVDGLDFIAWNNNKFTSSAARSRLEPASLEAAPERAGGGLSDSMGVRRHESYDSTPTTFVEPAHRRLSD